MPKKAYIASHFTTEELKKKYLKSLDPVEGRRWHLLWKIRSGCTIKDSANAVGLQYQYCQKVLKKYNEMGEEGVKNKRKRVQNHNRGKSPLLDGEQLEKLKQGLKSKPEDGGKWTGLLCRSMDRKGNRNRKSLESKRMGLSKKV